MQDVLFGTLTFHMGVMRERVSEEVLIGVVRAREGKVPLSPAHAEAVALAMKEWAIERGATHFCHWFHPWTELGAEKHDAFLDVGSDGLVIERFSGSWLLKGEPDASSFPSGGIRGTASARGYTCWDCQCDPFLWEEEHVKILCIPAIFFSWCGSALDVKLPLMRAKAKLQQAAERLLKALGYEDTVEATLGCEQEFFLVPRSLNDARLDLRLVDRTVMGAPLARGQEKQDHYFSPLPQQVLHFIREVEERAFALGIGLKTRHSEVAPQQFEVAPLFEEALRSLDHNLLLMQIMRKVAEERDLSCLFHEKPFAGINGSGKHCNWSLRTKSGQNLLDPSLLLTDPLLFLSFLTGVLSALYDHAPLLLASIASPGNDLRLGGHEAPPAILSVYLGSELENVLDAVEQGKEMIYRALDPKDLGVASLAHCAIDSLDRNRTSPFVFTGNKFEFRSVGSSAHPGKAILVLHAIVAESFDRLAARIEEGQDPREVLRDELRQSKPIRYLGDNYLEEWVEEAASRDLVCLKSSAYAFPEWLTKAADKVFLGLFSRKEREGFVQVQEDIYVQTLQAEAKVFLEMVYRQVLPICVEYETLLAKNLYWTQSALQTTSPRLKEHLLAFTKWTEEVRTESQELHEALESALSRQEDKALAFYDRVVPKMESLREKVDQLETRLPKDRYPFPQYNDLLFSL